MSESGKQRQLGVLRLSPGLLIGIFKDGFRSAYQIQQGLPDDAHLVAVRIDHFTGLIELLIASESYPLIDEGRTVSYDIPQPEMTVMSGRRCCHDD